MKAVVLEAPERFACIERAAPEPGPDEALVRIVGAGICASDVATIKGENPVAAYPVTPGHECVGVVEAAPASAPVRQGDWVTIYPSVGCGACPACREQRINHCPSFKVLGINRDSGFFTERVTVGADQLIPIPESLHRPEGAVVEPTAVGVHVNRRGGVRRGERALIIGAGVVGTLTAQVARAYGAAEVILVDRFESRRAPLARLGFDRLLLADGAPLAPQVLDQGGFVDVVYDTVCSAGTLDAAADVLAPGGRLVLVAVPHGDVPLTISFPKIYRRELSLIVSRNYVPDDFREAIRLIGEGWVDVDALITATYPLAEFAAAYADLTGHPERHLKVLLRP